MVDADALELGLLTVGIGIMIVGFGRFSGTDSYWTEKRHGLINCFNFFNTTLAKEIVWIIGDGVLRLLEFIRTRPPSISWPKPNGWALLSRSRYPMFFLSKQVWIITPVIFKGIGI
ncbi:unnamed protein product [Lupinus luteus]|uniref:Uncharacterized protein n=1 Tax=Lupinus luteus TaxID=3873 RepID=A0AAV1XLF5_LUPLU